MTIGVKRPEVIDNSLGPCHYTPERADSLTKQKTI